MPNPKIMCVDEKAEEDFFEMTKKGIDRFISEGGKLILFDWDGTVRANKLDQGIKNYIRSGFIKTYEYIKDLNLSVGVCSLRNTDQINNLTHLGIMFNEINGKDKMRDYIEKHPSRYHSKAANFQKLPKDEIMRQGLSCIEQIRIGKRPSEWQVIFQAAAELQKDIKNLYMAHRLSKGELTFLIDDDESSGGTAEKFGLGVLIPRPKGFVHDKKLV